MVTVDCEFWAKQMAATEEMTGDVHDLCITMCFNDYTVILSHHHIPGRCNIQQNVFKGIKNSSKMV